MIAKSIVAVLPLVGLARAHGCIWHPSMWGFNITDANSPQYNGRDNRPQAPLKGLSFEKWWFHGHLDAPPHPEDIMELPAGGTVTTELACDKDATSFYTTGPGGDHRNGNDPCPGPPSHLIHTNGIDDLGGCALAIAYKSDPNDVQPEDFVVFSVNHQCIWTRFTDFQVPANMPACPNGKCICAWSWIHREDAGGDEMYLNNFQCNVTGAKATTAIPQGQVPVRCADDSSKCVKGAKQPFYWDQAERNNMFDGIYTPPLYLPSYGFADGAQNDIWDTVGGSTSKSASTTTTSSSSAASTSTSVSAPQATQATSPSVPIQVAAVSTSSTTSSTSVPTAAPTSSSSSSTQPPAAAATPAQQGASDPDSSDPDSSDPDSSDPISTPSSSTGTPSATKSGQGHRTCRPKKKRSTRELYKGAAARHRSRRSRAL